MTADDLAEHFGQVSVRIDAIELTGFNQGSDNCPILPAAIRAREERVLPIERNGADRTLDNVGVDLDAPVVEETLQAVPARQGIADSFGKLRLLADEREFLAQPGFKFR